MPALFVNAEDQVPLLIGGVIWVTNRRRKIIIKYFGSLKEGDAVLLLVLASLLSIPFEYQHRGSDGNLTSALCRAEEGAGAPPASVGHERAVRARGCQIHEVQKHTLSPDARRLRRTVRLCSAEEHRISLGTE